MKNTRYYTNKSRSIKWDGAKCLHGAKCLLSIIDPIEKSGIYSIPANDKQFEEMLSQSRFCPSGALCLET
ncbi:MAG: (4Fe-4S)-binding protein [Bacteroidales bacterium]|nr:(4Fe-4S)-binding protein [Bacteroidales bacterium]